MSRNRDYDRKYYETHKAEIASRNKAWAEAHPTKIKAYSKKHAAKKRSDNFQKKYGITADQYDEMHEAQNGLCAVCCQPDPRRALSTDHNHKTKQVRSLLCARCNLLLGIANEDIAVLEKAAAYLRRWENA